MCQARGILCDILSTPQFKQVAGLYANLKVDTFWVKLSEEKTCREKVRKFAEKHAIPIEPEDSFEWFYEKHFDCNEYFARYVSVRPRQEDIKVPLEGRDTRNRAMLINWKVYDLLCEDTF